MQFEFIHSGEEPRRPWLTVLGVVNVAGMAAPHILLPADPAPVTVFLADDSAVTADPIFLGNLRMRENSTLL